MIISKKQECFIIKIKFDNINFFLLFKFFMNFNKYN